MSAGYGLALPSLGACGIDPYTMHQGQQPSTPSLSSAAVSSGSCGSTGSSSSLPALQPGYPPLSALVEAQQPHAGALQGPHYYFGHRHFNYSAPNLVMTNHGHHRYQSGSPTYDLEWTTPSPSHIRTPAAAISTSPAAHSPPLSAAEAATPGSGGATATSPYSSSLGSWDASSASASADSPAVSPALFYHHHHHPPPDAAMAAAAVAVAAAGQYHHPHYHHYSHHHHDDHQFQQQQAMPAQSSLYYDLPAPTVNTDYHPQQQPQSASEEQAAHAPSLEAMSRGRRGRKRRCDEAIMALHPSALLAVKEEEAEAESADELYHHHHRRHNQQQDQLQRQLDGSSSELASRRAGSHEWPFVASEESTMPADQLNSGSSEVDDDDFFSDDDDEETNDDDNECDSDRDGGEDSDDVDDDDDDDDDDAYAGTRAAKRSKRSAQQQQQQQQTTTMKKKKRRRKQVVKVERRVERRVEVTADLNIEAHLSPESDGYRWRKYGRKTVKGSPYPRSYFKCTFSHCPVKKQVEAVIRDGHIVSTSSIYKGKHNHDRPCVTQLTAHDQDSFRNAVLAGFADYDAAHAAREGTAEGGGGARSSAGNNTPRLVVTTEASVDYLDDGYRWRKYGQKYVKGSGYPRSYYKCTDKQCPVKKQVDALLVGLVVTYEGAHTHAPCLDKSAPRKRRRRNPAAPAATTTRRSRAGEAASTPVKFEPASSPEADELPLHPSSSSSPSADHSSPVAKQERRRSSHLASFRHSAHPVTYHPYHHPQQQPPPQYQQPQHYHQSYHHHHHHQQQHQQQHEYESNDHCAPASSGYHGPGFFPLELKKEKVEEEDHHLGGQHYHHHHQQPQQYQTRSALGSSEELSSYISGGFEDLHGEMTDFLMWEESGRGPRHGLLPPAPAHAFSHNSNAAGHYPHHHHHHHHQQQHCQASSFPPSISSPLSAPSSSSSFSYTTPLDYDYVPTSGSSFSV